MQFSWENSKSKYFVKCHNLNDILGPTMKNFKCIVKEGIE